MSTLLEKPFRARILIKAHEETEDGRWLVSGPIHDLKEDYDEETLEKSGLLKGLDMFVRMGAHVDWEHQYARTRDPDYVIGKGIEIKEIDNVPWLTTMLYKGKALAQKLWQHLQEGGEAGYSLEGLAKARHPRNPKHILLTEIHRITISLSPKSFGSRLRVGPAPALATLAKSLVAEYEAGDFAEWKRVNKALTTGEGIVGEGQTGGAALRKQEIAGGVAGMRSCPKCGVRNRRRREKCRNCGCTLNRRSGTPSGARLQAFIEKGYLGFDRLVHKLRSTGRSLQRARALAAFIGRRKYGARKFNRYARQGKKMRGARPAHSS